MSVSRETSLVWQAGAELGLRPAQLGKLLDYADLLDSDAGRLGLIGFGRQETSRHLIRALVLESLIDVGPSEWADVGSGAGLPGIPLTICIGSGHLIEPKRKAVGFLEKARRVLVLDLEVAAETAESAARRGVRKKVVVARALASPRKALQMCLPLCEEGGKIVLTAGPERSLGSEDLAGLPVADVRTVLLEGPLDIHQWAHIIARSPD